MVRKATSLSRMGNSQVELVCLGLVKHSTQLSCWWNKDFKVRRYSVTRIFGANWGRKISILPQKTCEVSTKKGSQLSIEPGRAHWETQPEASYGGCCWRATVNCGRRLASAVEKPASWERNISMLWEAWQLAVVDEDSKNTVAEFLSTKGEGLLAEAWGEWPSFIMNCMAHVLVDFDVILVLGARQRAPMKPLALAAGYRISFGAVVFICIHAWFDTLSWRIVD